MKRIRSKLARLLDERRMQQKELAEKANVRKATIHALYHDEMKQFPRDVLERIAEALDIDDITEILAIESEQEAKDRRSGNEQEANTHDKRLK